MLKRCVHVLCTYALINCVCSTMYSTAVAGSYFTFRTFFVQYTFPTHLTGDMTFLTAGLADLALIPL